MNTHNLDEVKPCTISEVAEIYGMSRKSMRRWLKPHLEKIGARIGRYYNINQMRIILDVFGAPGDLKDKDLLI